MIDSKLIKVVKGTLEADVTAMQEQILKGVIIMMTNNVCYEIDLVLSGLDKQLQTKRRSK